MAPAHQLRLLMPDHRTARIGASWRRLYDASGAPEPRNLAIRSVAGRPAATPWFAPWPLFTETIVSGTPQPQAAFLISFSGVAASAILQGADWKFADPRSACIIPLRPGRSQRGLSP